MTLDDATIRRGLDLTLAETSFAGLGALHRGKVRDSYVAGGKRTIVVTDRISAFDVILGTVPFKGQVLNGLAAFWFEKTADVAPNHLLSVPDPAVSVVEECEVYPVEMVVRAYLTGSSATAIWTHYARGERVYCGHRLPDGMRKHERLPRPIITPTTKASAGEHDEPISLDEVVSRGLMTEAELARASRIALDLFERGTALAAERGLILVDTKYELGRRDDGEMIVVDEIHTPDSSRYWYADSYEPAMRAGEDPRALDKEFVRRALAARGYRGEGPPPPLDEALRMEAARRYAEIYTQVTGQPFVPNLDPPVERIRRNLGLA